MSVIGPILTRHGGYAFDTWEPGVGLTRGIGYRRIGDAYYARNALINDRGPEATGRPIVCSTLDEFIAEISGQALAKVA